MGNARSRAGAGTPPLVIRIGRDLILRAVEFGLGTGISLKDQSDGDALRLRDLR